MKLIDMIEVVLAQHTKALHVDDIAIFLTEVYPNIQEDLNKLPGKVSSALAYAVKQKGSKFSKPKNKTGGFKKGMYRLKKKAAIKLPTAVPQPKVNSLYTGSAGEHAVLSELLFWGFNASIMAVDDGIDVVASKENSYFHIQVKTANPQADGGYGFGIKRDRFLGKHSASTFYIFVLRRRASDRYINDFIIMPSSDIKRLTDAEIVKGKDTLSFKVQIVSSGKYLLNKTEDVTRCVNSWAEII